MGSRLAPPLCLEVAEDPGRSGIVSGPLPSLPCTSPSSCAPLFLLVCELAWLCALYTVLGRKDPWPALVSESTTSSQGWVIPQGPLPGMGKETAGWSSAWVLGLTELPRAPPRPWGLSQEWPCLTGLMGLGAISGGKESLLPVFTAGRMKGYQGQRWPLGKPPGRPLSVALFPHGGETRLSC